jgi:hypothetical protein
MNDQCEPARTEIEEELLRAIAEIWARSIESNVARVRQLESITANLRDRGSLDPEAAQAAELDAHKLAGLFGSFGFDVASRLAREIELVLQRREQLGPRDGADLVQSSRILCEMRSRDHRDEHVCLDPQLALPPAAAIEMRKAASGATGHPSIERRLLTRCRRLLCGA